MWGVLFMRGNTYERDQGIGLLGLELVKLLKWGFRLLGFLWKGAGEGDK